MEFAQEMTKRDSNTCYAYSNGGIKADSSYKPCSIDHGACCVDGDQCLPVQDNVHMCYSPNNKTDFQTYYVAGCTDSTFKADYCQKNCENEPHGAVKWQGGTVNQWACCGVNGVGHTDCTVASRETFTGPPQSFYDDYVKDSGDVKHVAKLAAGVIAGIAIACVVAALLCCFMVWRCCFSRHARERKSRGKFMPLGKTRGTEDVWDANMHNNQNTELHEGPPGSYGYGGQGAPYNPPQQQGPQYTVANFR